MPIEVKILMTAAIVFCVSGFIADALKDADGDYPAPLLALTLASAATMIYSIIALVWSI